MKITFEITPDEIKQLAELDFDELPSIDEIIAEVEKWKEE